MENKMFQKGWQIIPNPYIAGIPVENDAIFVGRESLANDAVIALEKNPVFVVGHRRMGITSLLKYIQRHYLKSEKIISVYITAEKFIYNNTNNFLFSFCRHITEELEDYQILTKEESERCLFKIRENGIIDFNLFFDNTLNKVKTQNKTLILIIDEYPIIYEAIVNGQIDSQFTSLLRGYLQNNSKEFKIIYSDALSLKYLISSQSKNVMGIWKSIEVSFLEEKNVRKLISKPTNDQMHFEDDSFLYLMDLTNGHPFLFRLF